MKKMKKLTAIFLALVMALGLVGCGAKDEPAEEKKPDAPATEDETVAEEVSFEFWLMENDLNFDTMTGTKWVAEAALAYMEDHPEVNIELVPISADPVVYGDKWDLAASTNSFPDLFVTDANYIDEWAEAGVLAELTDDISEELKNSFAPGTIEASNQYTPGHIYGIPYRADTFGWIYNLEVFEKCNLEIPETWDELLHCIEVFNENGITPIAAGGMDTWATWGFHPIFAKFGFTYEMAQQIQAGELKYADCEPMIRGFEALDELAKAGAFSEEAYGMNHAQAMASFVAGEAAMYTTYSAIVTDTPEGERGFAEYCAYDFGPEVEGMPLGGKSGLRRYAFSVALGTVAQSDPVKYAAILDFVDYLFSEECQQLQIKGGTPLVTKYEYDTSNLTPLEEDLYASISEEIIIAGYSFNDWYESGYNKGYWSVLNGVMLQQCTVEEALATLQESVDVMLEQ